MIEILHNLNLDGKVIRLITNLYWSQLATVNIHNNLTPWFEIKRCLPRMCSLLSPHLFSIYGEMILRSSLQWVWRV